MSTNASTCTRRSDRLCRVAAVSIVLTAILSPLSHTEAALANQNRRGLRATTIEGVLRLQEEDIDVGTAALAVPLDGVPRTMMSSP